MLWNEVLFGKMEQLDVRNKKKSCNIEQIQMKKLANDNGKLKIIIVQKIMWNIVCLINTDL